LATDRSVVSTLWWLGIMFAFAELITAVIFCVATPPLERGSSFYMWLCVVMGAEMVFFAWTANYALAHRTGSGVGSATLITVHMLIVVWVAIAIVLAIVARTTPLGKGASAPWLAIVYALVTFFLLFGTSALYMRDLAVASEDRLKRAQRLELQVHALDVDQTCRDLRALPVENPEERTAIDRLVKKLEAIRTSFDFAPPGKSGTLEEDEAREVGDLDEQIQAATAQLRDGVAALKEEPGGTPARLQALNGLADEIESLLRERQQRLLVGGRA